MNQFKPLSIVTFLPLCLFLLAGCGANGPDKARTKLAQLNIAYTPEAFRRAVKDGDAVAVKLFLDAGMDPNVNFTSEKGTTTPLFLAALFGHKEVAALLVDKGANIDGKAYEVNTPLHAACGNTNVELVRLLIAKGARLDERGMDGMTPLHIACGSTTERVASLLLEKGAGANERDVRGSTPLMMTSDPHIVDLLLKKRADVNIASSNGMTAVMIAAGTGNIPMLKRLLEAKPDLEAKTSAGETAMDMADTNVVQVLRDAGARIWTDWRLSRMQQTFSESGQSLIAGAAERVQDNGGNDTASVELVRDALYGPKAVERWKQEGIGDRQLAALLLASVLSIERGSGLNAALFKQPDEWAKDPRKLFIDKVQTGSWNTFTNQLAVAVAADPAAVNVCESAGYTALMAAVLRDDVPTIKWLLDHGADRSIANKEDGGTALTLAQSLTRNEAIAILKKSAGQQ